MPFSPLLFFAYGAVVSFIICLPAAEAAVSCCYSATAAITLRRRFRRLLLMRRFRQFCRATMLSAVFAAASAMPMLSFRAIAAFQAKYFDFFADFIAIAAFSATPLFD